MKLIDFDNREDLAWLLEEIERIEEVDGIDILVCVYKKRNGEIGFGATRADEAEVIGLLELGKAELIDGMMYED